MKRGILFPVLVLALAAAAAARAEDAPEVASAGGKKIKVTLGTLVRVIDLGREIAGCTERVDPAEPQRRIRESARFGIIDEVQRNGRFYLLLWALAHANCNVQGHCGEGEDCTLVWLQLDERLRLERKQSLVVQECRAETGIPGMDLEFPENDLRMANGKLALKFGDLVGEAPSWTRVLYERAACEQGLRVMASGSGE